MVTPKNIQKNNSDFPKLGAPALRALTNAGYTKLLQLTKTSETELLKLHGMGPSTIKILKQALSRQKKNFA